VPSSRPPRTTPRPPKTPTRLHQIVQDLPKSVPRAPKRPQDRPKTPKNASKRPKVLLRTPKNSAAGAWKRDRQTCFLVWLPWGDLLDDLDLLYFLILSRGPKYSQERLTTAPQAHGTGIARRASSSASLRGDLLDDLASNRTEKQPRGSSEYNK